jgi:hypothetical protein
MTRVRLTLLPALALVPLGCHAAAHDAPAPAPSAEATIISTDTQVHPEGELARGRDYTMSVESVRDCPLEGPFAPKKGFSKLGIEVELEGQSSVEVPVNPFYATLYEPSLENYASTLAGCEPGLPSVRVTAGHEARGFVTFEVPKASRIFELRYTPLVIGPGTEELRFKVVR